MGRYLMVECLVRLCLKLQAPRCTNSTSSDEHGGWERYRPRLAVDERRRSMGVYSGHGPGAGNGLDLWAIRSKAATAQLHVRREFWEGVGRVDAGWNGDA
jgi:hypothetical protein